MAGEVELVSIIVQTGALGVLILFVILLFRLFERQAKGQDRRDERYVEGLDRNTEGAGKVAEALARQQVAFDHLEDVVNECSKKIERLNSRR